VFGVRDEKHSLKLPFDEYAFDEYAFDEYALKVL